MLCFLSQFEIVKGVVDLKLQPMTIRTWERPDECMNAT